MKLSLKVRANSARKLRNLEGADPRDEFRKSLGMLLITLTTFFSGQQYSMFQVHADNYFKHFQAEDLKWWIDLFSPMASLILMTGVYFLSQKSFRVGYMTSLGLSFLSSFLYTRNNPAFLPGIMTEEPYIVSKNVDAAPLL